jgi:hypothetical protein
MNTQFDTLEYAAKLEAAGVPPAQAAVHAQALGGVVAELAFAADLKTVDKNLRGEMAAMEKRLLDRIDAVRVEVLGKIDAVRNELIGKIDAVHNELLGKIDVLRSLIGVLIALDIGILVKLLLM